MKIVTSNSSRGAYRGVIEILKKNLSNGDNIIIAPDRFTASVERGLLNSLASESTFGIDVMSFTRLANKLIGKDINKCLTPEGSVMLIRRVIDKNIDKLNYYGKVAKKEGFENELYAALTALRNSGITAGELLDKADNMPAALARKTRDIALIYDLYGDALQEKFSDSSTRLAALAKYIAQDPQCVATKHFYITDIYDFSAPEFEIVRQLGECALSLTIGIPNGYGNPNSRIYPGKIIQKLRSLGPDKVEVTYNPEVLDPPIEAISTRLFSYRRVENRVENNGKVRLRCAKNRQEEILALALDISDRVMNGGRYKDFEVFVSDMNDYEAEIKSVFARYGIPFFIDKKELLSEQTKVRYLLLALSAVTGGLKRRDVLDFVKNPLFSRRADIGDDSVFRFENYALKYNIEFSRFENEFVLSNATVNGECECSVPERVREKTIQTLAPLLKLADGEHASNEFRAACESLLDDAEQEWREHVERVASISEYYQKCAEQVDDKIKSVLDELSEVIDADMTLKEFENLLRSMLKTLKIALVPTFLDCVFVGDTDSRYMGAGDIYILGATNDKFPRGASGGAVLTPSDEELFEKLGVDIYLNSKQRVLTDMYAALDIMKKPHGRLVISYPETGDGTAVSPSMVLDELRGMLMENNEPLLVERLQYDSASGLDADKLAKLLLTEKSSKYEALRASDGDFEGGKALGSAIALSDDPDALEKLLFAKAPERVEMKDMELASSVSRLECFYNCPYSHFFRYILKLKKRKEAEPEGTENGIIIHYVLENFFKDVRDGKVGDEADIASRAEKYFDEAVKKNDFEVLLEKPDTGRLLLRVKAESVRVCKDLYKISLRSEFRPAMLEVKIGAEGGLAPMTLLADGKSVRLKGVIDRVDIYNDNFIIIDYKTYKSADLSYKELYYGQKLQLYIYMQAVKNALKTHPCGVFYLPIFTNFTDENVNRYKYKGQTTDSRELLAKIDSRVLDDPAGSIVPFKEDKNGLNREVHLGTKEFDALGDYAVRLASEGAKQILGGYIKPSPVEGACDRCDYMDICAYKARDQRKLGRATLSAVCEEEGTDDRA